jgi:hypothetical protein
MFQKSDCCIPWIPNFLLKGSAYENEPECSTERLLSFDIMNSFYLFCTGWQSLHLRSASSAQCDPECAEAHAGGNQAEDDSVPASAGAPGEAGNVIACGYQPPHPCQAITR